MARTAAERKRRVVGRLTARQIANARPGRGLDASLLADGGNLYLQLTRGDASHIRRSWLFRYQLNERRREMGLGALHTRSLKEAREEAKRLRQLLLDGTDPLERRRKDIEGRAVASAKNKTSGTTGKIPSTSRNGKTASPRTPGRLPACRLPPSTLRMCWKS